MGKPRMPERVYRAVMDRAEDMAGWPACEALIPGVCGGVAEHWHHRQLRSQGGEHVVVNGIGICSDCHDYIHGHPAESYRNGWLIHGWDDPAKTPFLRRGVWSQPMENGTVIECLSNVRRRDESAR